MVSGVCNNMITVFHMAIITNPPIGNLIRNVYN